MIDPITAGSDLTSRSIPAEGWIKRSDRSLSSGMCIRYDPARFERIDLLVLPTRSLLFPFITSPRIERFGDYLTPAHFAGIAFRPPHRADPESTSEAYNQGRGSRIRLIDAAPGIPEVALKAAPTGIISDRQRTLAPRGPFFHGATGRSRYIRASTSSIAQWDIWLSSADSADRGDQVKGPLEIDSVLWAGDPA